jgi:hypothetical protein
MEQSQDAKQDTKSAMPAMPDAPGAIPWWDTPFAWLALGFVFGGIVVGVLSVFRLIGGSP